VKAGLVQLPSICVGPRSTRAGPAAAVEDVDVDPPAAAVVVVELSAAVVVVDPLLAFVAVEPLGAVVDVEVDPAEVGSLYAGAADDSLADPSVVPFNANPTRSAITMATSSCHVAQLRLPLIRRSPGAGMGSSPPGPAPPGAVPALLLDGGGSDMAKRWPGFSSPSRRPRHELTHEEWNVEDNVNRRDMSVNSWRTLPDWSGEPCGLLRDDPDALGAEGRAWTRALRAV
jgi:hypothetical protein